MGIVVAIWTNPSKKCSVPKQFANVKMEVPKRSNWSPRVRKRNASFMRVLNSMWAEMSVFSHLNWKAGRITPWFQLVPTRSYSASEILLRQIFETWVPGCSQAFKCVPANGRVPQIGKSFNDRRKVWIDFFQAAKPQTTNLLACRTSQPNHKPQTEGIDSSDCRVTRKIREGLSKYITAFIMECNVPGGTVLVSRRHSMLGDDGEF